MPRPATGRVPRLTLVLLFVSLLLQSPPSPAAAPPAVVTVATGVSPEATAENSQRKLLADPAGRLFLTFIRPVQGTDQVSLAESADGGRTWRTTQVTRDSHPARLPSLALFPEGSLHLVWTEYAPVGRIYHAARRGGRWTEPAGLSTPGIYAGIPVVAPRGGRAHVLWYGILPERPSVRTRHGSVYEIVFTRQEGAGWSRPVSISPGIPDSLNPSMTAGSGGRLHAAWYQFDSRVYQIRYAVFDGGWSSRYLTGGPAEHTAVALETSDRDVHLVWVEHGAARRVVYLRLGAAPEVLATGSVHDPVLAVAGGRVVAAWRQDNAIVLRQVRPLGAPVRVGEGSGPVVVLRGAVAYVAWTTADALPNLRFAAIPLR